MHEKCIVNKSDHILLIKSHPWGKQVAGRCAAARTLRSQNEALQSWVAGEAGTSEPVGPPVSLQEPGSDAAHQGGGPQHRPLGSGVRSAWKEGRSPWPWTQSVDRAPDVIGFFGREGPREHSHQVKVPTEVFPLLFHPGRTQVTHPNHMDTRVGGGSRMQGWGGCW